MNKIIVCSKDSDEIEFVFSSPHVTNLYLSTSKQATSLDFSNFNSNSLEKIDFGYCQLLKKLDLSLFNTSKVKLMDDAFSNCESLTSLNVDNWDTSNVTSMNRMFDRCCSLVSLDLNSFNTSKVESMNEMFYECEHLETLDISSFDFSNLDHDGNEYMFGSCSSLTHLKFGKNLRSSIDFRDCPLTHESVLSVIDGLAKIENGYQYITFSNETYKSLTAEDCKKLFDKNWICSTSLVFDYSLDFTGCTSLTVTNVLYSLTKTPSTKYIFIDEDTIEHIDKALIKDTLCKGFIIIAR